ncbi:MAG: hypothetical protein RL079_512, partial [Verrucomicrobiota bacterium]
VYDDAEGMVRVEGHVEMGGLF